MSKLLQEILDRTRVAKGAISAYVELHIEQGPFLEREGFQLGIVSAIAAPAALRVTFTGQGGHAGGLLMPDRWCTWSSTNTLLHGRAALSLNVLVQLAALHAPFPAQARQEAWGQLSSTLKHEPRLRLRVHSAEQAHRPGGSLSEAGLPSQAKCRFGGARAGTRRVHACALALSQTCVCRHDAGLAAAELALEVEQAVKASGASRTLSCSTHDASSATFCFAAAEACRVLDWDLPKSASVRKLLLSYLVA